jgi:hypothetical protein
MPSKCTAEVAQRVIDDYCQSDYSVYTISLKHSMGIVTANRILNGQLFPELHSPETTQAISEARLRREPKVEEDEEFKFNLADLETIDQRYVEFIKQQAEAYKLPALVLHSMCKNIDTKMLA